MLEKRLRPLILIRSNRNLQLFLTASQLLSSTRDFIFIILETPRKESEANKQNEIIQIYIVSLTKLIKSLHFKILQLFVFYCRVNVFVLCCLTHSLPLLCFYGVKKMRLVLELVNKQKCSFKQCHLGNSSVFQSTFPFKCIFHFLSSYFSLTGFSDLNANFYRLVNRTFILPPPLFFN